MSNPNTKVISCDVDVKKFASQFLSHKKCSSKKTYKYASKVNGKYLNDYVTSKAVFKSVISDGYCSKPFKARKHYFICSTLKTIIEKHNSNLPVVVSPPIPDVNVAPSTAPSKLPKDIPSTSSSSVPDRAERLFLRNRIPVKSLKGITAINLKIAGDEDVVVDPKSLPRNKKSYIQSYQDDVIAKSSPFKKPFRYLSMKEKKLRTNDLAKTILAACITRKEYKKNGSQYLNENTQLAVDVLNILDDIKNTLQSKLRIDFKVLEDEPVPPAANDDEGLINSLDESNEKHKLAIILLCGSSQTDYTRMKHNMESFMSLPSYYMLTKDRPSISPVTYTLSSPLSIDSTTSAMPNNQSMSEAEILESALRETASPTDKVDGAVIDGGYSHHMQLLKDNHVKHGRTLSSDSDVIVLDSIDGAEHTRSNKSIRSVLSFSSSLFSSDWIIKKEVTAGSSLNILTWQQVQAVENLPTMLATTQEYYKQKSELRSTGNDRYSFYDLHDGKMLYLLTQHSSWNRKHHPFIWCTCKRGQGVLNNQKHKCEIISDANHQTYYQLSKTRYEKKEGKKNKDGTLYSKKEHLDWADKKNYGCTHFGIDPVLLPRSSLRFDTFHLKCSITRRLMSYLRLFLLDQAPSISEGYCSAVLSKFWNKYHIWVWQNKKNFSSFMGNELA